MKEVCLFQAAHKGESKLSASTVIRQRLKDLNISQSSLARAMGTTPQNLNNKLARDTLSVEELCKIGEILNFTVILKADKEYTIEY